MRHVLLSAVSAAALMALTVTLSAGAAQSKKPHITNHGRPTGLVAPHARPGRASVGHFRSARSGETNPGATGSASAVPPSPTKKDNLTYGGPDQLPVGPVMHSSTVYALFWDPGNALSGDYKSLVGQYFTDVASDSGSANNVYAPATQYTDSNGALAYNVRYAGALDDNDAYPTSGCTEPSDVQNSSSPTTHCLTDDQLQQEVETYVTANSLPYGASTEYFIYTPQHVGSCFPDSSSDSGYDCAYDTYCAYHSAFFDGSNEYIYANMPYQDQAILDSNGDNVNYECDTGEHPNGDDSGGADAANAGDDVLSVTSHEQNESITDPTGYAWWDDNPRSIFQGFENGDLCAWSWFTPTAVDGNGNPTAFGPDGTDSGVGSGEDSMSSGQAYNQTINGDHYFVQGEWSNSSATTKGWSGCVWTYDKGPTTGDTAPTIDGGSGVQVGDTLTAHSGKWVSNAGGGLKSFKYTWLRCNSGGTSCKSIRTDTVNFTVAPSRILGTAGPNDTYVVQKADWKSTIEVSVSAVDADGTSAPAVSSATDVVHGEPTASVDPTVTGTATVGQTLTGHPGTWDANSNAITGYKWTFFRCLNSTCKSAKSGSEKTDADVPYVLTAADDKATLYFEVVATNGVGPSAADDSAQTGAVDGEPSGGAAQLTNTTLSATPATDVTVGDVLTIDTASTPWNAHGLPITSYIVTWQYFNTTLKTISTATLKPKNGVVPTTATLVVPATADHYLITVSVVATNAAGKSDAVTASTNNVAGEPTNSGAPTLVDAGGFHVGETVTVDAGTWTAHGGTLKTYSYALYRCDSSGTTCDSRAFKTLTSSTASASYKLASGDLNHKLYVIVTVAGSNKTTSDGVSSSKVGPVAAAPH